MIKYKIGKLVHDYRLSKSFLFIDSLFFFYIAIFIYLPFLVIQVDIVSWIFSLGLSVSSCRVRKLLQN